MRTAYAYNINRVTQTFWIKSKNSRAVPFVINFAQNKLPRQITIPGEREQQLSSTRTTQSRFIAQIAMNTVSPRNYAEMIQDAVSVEDHITVKSVKNIFESVVTAVPSIIPETKTVQKLAGREDLQDPA